MAKEPKVSIIIVNYNGAEYLPELFTSLAKQTFQDFELVVVDNASVDDSVKFLKAQKELKLVESNENLGFADANNLGVKLAVGKYVALLNNDTVVDAKWLEKLVSALEKEPKRGAVVAKIYLAKAGLHKKVFDSAGSLYNNIGSCWSRGYLEEDIGQYEEEEEVPMGTACSLLFRREVLEQTYLFDPDYFMYVEEFDFNLRLRKLGYTVWYVPSSIVWHKTSQAVRNKIKNERLKMKNVRETLFKQEYGNTNRLNLLIKHYPTSLLLKNAFLIFLSFVYWDYYFAWHGGVRAYFSLKTRQWKMLRKGWKERKIWAHADPAWQQWMTQHSLQDLLQFKRETEEKRLQYGE